MMTEIHPQKRKRKRLSMFDFSSIFSEVFGKDKTEKTETDLSYCPEDGSSDYNKIMNSLSIAKRNNCLERAIRSEF